MAALPVISLCTGGAGLERGLKLAGVGVRPVLYVEREAFSAAYLVAQMELGRLAQAPVWSDLGRIPAGVLRELAGMGELGIVGGFPCQPWSAAGRREGVEDERWIWPAIDRIFRLSRPEWCFLENVPGLVHGGIKPVLRTLAESGLDAEWCCVRASDAGAPHRRERLFILGLSDAFRERLRVQPGRGETGWSGEAEPRDVGWWVADTARKRCAGLGLHLLAWRSCDAVLDTDGRGAAVAHPECNGGRERPERAEHQREACRRGLAVEGDCGAVGDVSGPRLQGRPTTAQQRRASADDRRGAVEDPAWSERGARPAGRGVPEAGRALEHADSLARGETLQRQPPRRLAFPPGPRDDWRGVPLHLWPALNREEERRILGDAAGRLQRDLGQGEGGVLEQAESRAAGDGELATIVDQEAAQLAIRGLAHGLDECRVDLLRLLGNGVVPHQAAIAFQELIRRIGG